MVSVNVAHVFVGFKRGNDVRLLWNGRVWLERVSYQLTLRISLQVFCVPLILLVSLTLLVRIT